jgi:hypothetical protein
MKQYISNVWWAIDVLVNVSTGGRRETISSRMGRNIQQGKRCAFCRGVCWLLSRFWPDHCTHNIMEPLDKA